MLKIEGKEIEITRGNMLPIDVTAKNEVTGGDYEFQPGDVIRFTIFDKKNVETVYLQKDFNVEEAATMVQIVMTAGEMKIGELSNKSAIYWWELELNPDTDKTQTIVGYTKDEGPAIITIVPEGGDQ